VGHDGDIPGYTTSVYHNYDLNMKVVVIASSDVQVGAGEHAPAPAPAAFQAIVQALTG
jgi:D-alanyl-D-alanine carboxypeptidase